MAKKLDAKPGDTLTMLVSMKGGGMNAVDLDVAGIEKIGYSQADDYAIMAPLSAIQNVLMIGGAAERFTVLLDKTADTGKLEPKIRSIAKKYGLEYRRWESLAVYYNAVKQMFDAVYMIIVIIVMAIIVFTVTNTIHMALFERVREIGTIRALGTTRDSVSGIFVAESAILGFFGSLLGIAAGYIICSVIQIAGGLPLKEIEDSTAIRHVFFTPDWNISLLSLVFFTAIAAAAAWRPSRKAAKMRIADALRWQ